MFKNYLKTSWRNIIKEKGYSGFNILGLAIGMAVALIIGLWVQYQVSYDRWLPDYGQAHKIMVRGSRNGVAEVGSATCLPLADAIKKDVPEVKYVAQTDISGQHSLMVGDKKLYSKGMFAGEDFLKIFRFSLLQGNAGDVLKQPASIVLTRSTAIALFGHTDPVNKTIRLDNLHDLKVSGVLGDLPGNSSLTFDYIIPFSYYIQTQDWIRQNMGNWNLDPIQTFVALQPNAGKVLGASVTQVWMLLSGEFIVLVTLSCLIAAPVAFYFMHGWLQTYYYRITIGPGVFIASAAAAVSVTVVTISLQAIKAALMNPVESLRTE